MKDEIINAMSVVINVLKKESDIDIIHGFTPELKYYGYKVGVTLKTGATPYRMERFTKQLQKCLPGYCVTEFKWEYGKKWLFEVFLDLDKKEVNENEVTR